MIEKWGVALVVSTIAVLAPIQPLMIAVGFLIFADLVTGIMAARKRGEAITSRAMSRTVWKACCYQLLVVSGFAMEHLVSDALPVAKLCAGLIGLVEFKSLAENVRTVTGVDLRSVVTRVTGSGRE